MDSVSGVGVLDKAVVVWEVLLAHGPLGLADLTARSGLPRATTHRLATAMEVHGLVRRTDDGRYALGRWLVTLGRAATESDSFVERARPILERLRDQTGESVQLYVREGEVRRCVLSLQSPHGLRWIVPEGSLLPLGAGSAGHVLVGDDVGRHGWVQSVGEREAGVASVSAPVRDTFGTVIAAVSVSGPIERLSTQPGRRFGSHVVVAATELERSLV
ncbi:MAG: IclR family transcriptional regulator [Actinomycetota bacterium]|nr:IclR family transcriptional regulator [Actinomycetota bacterium]MDA2972307.1 IclR family transcriptional regulator [Actinomycetota bacterium]MDA3002117.1 IclR family transcriptional regulator [Actinomycetota bacterium]